MDVAGFNALDAAAAVAVVRPCAEIDRWAEAVVAGRPYADRAALLDHAEAISRDWTGADLHAALAHHPRIGERPTGVGASAALSSAEQAGVDPDDADLQQRLKAANAAYEDRFGRIFLVRAAGRTAPEMLALLEERLGHDDATEVEVTLGQLREIALLRLSGAVA